MAAGDSHHAPYCGAPGSTRKVWVHYSCPCGTIVAAEVYRSVNVGTDPALQSRLLALDPAQTLNTVACPDAGQLVPVPVPVVYHDPERHLLALMLPESSRHRELQERAALLGEMAADSATVPAYAVNFAVVFGTAGLQDLIRDGQTGTVATASSTADADLQYRAARVEAKESALTSKAAQLAAKESALASREARLEAKEAELAAREASLQQSAQAGRRAVEDTALASENPQLAPRGRDRPELEAPALRHSAAPAGNPASNPARGVADAAPSAPAATSAPAAPSAPAATSTAPNDVPPAAAPDDASAPSAPASVRSARSGPTSAPSAPTGASRPSADVTMVARIGEDAVEVLPDQLGEGGIVIADQAASARPADAVQPRRHHDDATLVGSAADVAVAHWLTTDEPSFKLLGDTGKPRIAVRVAPAAAAALAGPTLTLRVQLHRFPSGPLVVLAIGNSAAFDGSGGAPEPVAVLFDLDADRDRAVLDALSRDFTFTLDAFRPDHSLVRKCMVSGELAENVRYVLAVADVFESAERSFAASAAAFAAADYDRYGWQHPERAEFRPDKLADLATAMKVRRALAVADRFTEPKREEYLFLLRGYPAPRWYDQRREALAQAVALGLWMGSRLAHVAVSEGLARSRRSLLAHLRKNFVRLLSGSDAQDLDADAISDNWAALEKETTAYSRVAERLGEQPVANGARTPAGQAVDSAQASAVSGTIGDTVQIPQVGPEAAAVRQPVPAANSAASPEAAIAALNDWSVAELMVALADAENQTAAAVVLINRGDRRFIEPVMAAVERMNRNQALQVLARMPGLGRPAIPALVRGLEHPKGFVRQGCALALATLGGAAAVEGLCDLLLNEPTDMWREIARGLGQIGPSAIMILASRLARLPNGSSPASPATTADVGPEDAVARAGWAMAHIAARGGVKQVSQLADTREPNGAKAAHCALDQVEQARQDDQRLHDGTDADEQDLHRAFSRRFFAVGAAGAARAPAASVTATLPSLQPGSHAPRSDAGTDSEMLLTDADILESTE